MVFVVKRFIAFGAYVDSLKNAVKLQTGFNSPVLKSMTGPRNKNIIENGKKGYATLTKIKR